MTSRMFVSSSSNVIRRGMFSPCVSRHRLTHPRSMVTAVRRLVASAHSRRSPPSSAVGVRCLSSSTTPEEPEEPRESMAFDVLVVGGGPAGLASAIRLKQLCAETGKDLSVCLIDKGSEIGSHILSGNVFDPIAMHELFPDKSDRNSDSHWTRELLEATGSHATPVAADEFHVLSAGSGLKLPNFLLPPQLHNDGNYIVSLSQICRWLGGVAEEMGVEVYPGFAAAEVLTTADGTAVTGVATRDVGLSKDGAPKPTYERGVALHARQTLLAEGARGSCSEWLMNKFGMRDGDGKNENSSSSHPQMYGLGLKEVWQVPPEQFQPGFVQHTLGYPLQSGPMDKVYGGSFLYHQEPDLVLVGLVVGLDYENPYLNPYQEFQRWKTHPAISKHLEGGTCLSYGARVLNEGGYHSIPSKLTVPGAALMGCSAGFLNAVKIKGSHTALKSGMLAAEAAFAALTADENETPVAETMELDTEAYQFPELTAYQKSLQDSWIYKELYEVRNAHAAFAKWGVLGGLAHTALAAHVTKGREPWTLHAPAESDSAATQPASSFAPIQYPAADGKLTFDLLTNLQRSGTYHAEDQPIHLRVKPDCADIPESISLPKYAGPEQRFCPAAVYEYVDNDDGDDGDDTKSSTSKKLVINSQNCIHCKCCSIKMPGEYIEWTVPEGGGGPQYQNM